LPRNVNPIPDTNFDPNAPAMAEPDPTIPTLAPLRELPLPQNPNQPYMLPMMEPICPYTSSCANEAPGSDCVNYKSWGFDEAQMAAPSPGSMYFNSISCNYVMAPGGRLTVPGRVGAVWQTMRKREMVMKAYEEPLDIEECEGLEIGKTVGSFCHNTVFDEAAKFLCQSTWDRQVARNCRRATPPMGLTGSSRILEICKLECQGAASRQPKGSARDKGRDRRARRGRASRRRKGI
jgi:hypothetical protein